jgi:hypothetical protein
MRRTEFAEPHDDVARSASMLQLSTRLSVFPQHQQTHVSDFFEERQMQRHSIQQSLKFSLGELFPFDDFHEKHFQIFSESEKFMNEFR